jgi:sulfide:quinone oxidoreductase
MSSPRPSSDPFRVVIAGGGVAALETALALRDLGGDRLDLTLVAPNPDFVYRPLAVREPFASGAAERHSLSEMADDLGLELIRDSFAWVDPHQRAAHTEAGHQLDYDALVLALGARAHPRYEHAVTVDDAHLDDLLHGIIQDIEGGYLHRLAFVVPGRIAWPLPIYELALMTARRAYDMNVELAVTIATPEAAPLAIFGEGASRGVAELLAETGVSVVTSAACEVPDDRHVVINPGDRRLEVDRVIALPELFGPAVRGLPAGEHGFIPIDTRCQVRGLDGVYAAGDATDYHVKHGGIAAQQADTAAAAIAALAGLPVEAAPFRPVIHGVLLTGAAPRYLSAEVIGSQGFSSEITDQPTWSPPTKIAARYLAPYLDARDRVGGAA